MFLRVTGWQTSSLIIKMAVARQSHALCREAYRYQFIKVGWEMTRWQLSGDKVLFCTLFTRNVSPQALLQWLAQPCGEQTLFRLYYNIVLLYPTLRKNTQITSLHWTRFFCALALCYYNVVDPKWADGNNYNFLNYIIVAGKLVRKKWCRLSLMTRTIASGSV